MFFSFSENWKSKLTQILENNILLICSCPNCVQTEPSKSEFFPKFNFSWQGFFLSVSPCFLINQIMMLIVCFYLQERSQRLQQAKSPIWYPTCRIGIWFDPTPKSFLESIHWRNFFRKVPSLLCSQKQFGWSKSWLPSISFVQ